MNGFCGGTDHVEHQVGMGKHGDVAAVERIGGGAHALRYEAFKIRVDGAIVVGHDVPTRLRPPGGARGVPAEKIGGRCIVSCPDKLLLSSERSPAKQAIPSGRNQIRPSATSM